MRRKTRYTVLDNMDEQERVELRPKFSESRLTVPPQLEQSSPVLVSSGVKHRSTEHNCSLMLSESELDSEQDGAGRSRPRVQAGGGSTFG